MSSLFCLVANNSEELENHVHEKHSDENSKIEHSRNKPNQSSSSSSKKIIKDNKRCEDCNKTFSNKSFFQRHVAKAHNNEKSQEGEATTDVSMTNDDSIKESPANADLSKVDESNVVDLTFKDGSNDADSSEIVDSSEDAVKKVSAKTLNVECSLCSSTFSNKSNLKRHQSAMHYKKNVSNIEIFSKHRKSRGNIKLKRKCKSLKRRNNIEINNNIINKTNNIIKINTNNINIKINNNNNKTNINFINDNNNSEGNNDYKEFNMTPAVSKLLAKIEDIKRLYYQSSPNKRRIIDSQIALESK